MVKLKLLKWIIVIMTYNEESIFKIIKKDAHINVIYS